MYAENAVSHMLNGKAVTRALRGHGLVHMALQSLIVSEVFNLDLIGRDLAETEGQGDDAQESCMEHVAQITRHAVEIDDSIVQPHCEGNNASILGHSNNVSDEITSGTVSETVRESTMEGISHEVDTDLESALRLFDKVLIGEIDIEQASEDEIVTKIQSRMNAYCDQLSSESRTARLWLQYIEMVELLRQFIKAERTGKWQLHLKTLRDMLPFFTASGHNLYAKSAYLYLVKMNALQKTHPKLYDYFMKGFHVVRRSDRYWAGLSTDLVIEQMLIAV